MEEIKRKKYFSLHYPYPELKGAPQDRGYIETTHDGRWTWTSENDRWSYSIENARVIKRRRIPRD